MTEKHLDATEKYIDPICGMTVMPETAAAKYEPETVDTVYFCSVGCKNKYVSQIETGGDKNIYTAKPANCSKKNGVEIVSHGGMKAAPDGEYIDPVCGMSVAPETAAGKYDFAGKTYYFCSVGCVHKFKQNPSNFLEKKKEEKNDDSGKRSG
jgi:Cu+-exporting ATPase